ncbi:glutaredoxin family protein [Candidatus Woesearchaeota archaeon]|nr:glutaredoxin family protein [Candidatus Woesearchaeota archaeon]
MPKSFPKVTVYSTPVCPWCVKTKEFLKEQNVPFQEVNVLADRSAADEMIRKSGQMGVPVVEIGNEVIVGFNKSAMKKALDIA